MRYFLITLAIVTTSISQSVAQEVTKQEFDSLKSIVFDLKTDIGQIELNLQKSEKKLRTGMLISTIGYSVVIIGGQLLGGENNDLGEALLYTGGAIGIGGTLMLFQGFKLLNQSKVKG